MGRVVSVNVSAETGERKKPVEQIELVADHGIRGDAHAGRLPDRQVSLLADESIDKMRALGLDVGPGAFAENITTRGVDLVSLPLGSKLLIGDAVLEITKIGKECHNRCAIYEQAGDCVMPREGVFARVSRGGLVKPGDSIAAPEE